MNDGVTSEVGRLRTVLLHRPGDELKRLTPRNNVELLFDGIPWLERAQEEHDAFAEALRTRGVEVLYVLDLLTAALDSGVARQELLADTVAPQQVGPALAPALTDYLLSLSSPQLAEVLTAGLSYEEVAEAIGTRERASGPGSSTISAEAIGTRERASGPGSSNISTGAGPQRELRSGVVARLASPRSFVIPPLPNLLFTRDSSLWIDRHVAVTSPNMSARAREASITRAIYRHSPRFAGTPLLYGDNDAERPEAFLEGGDVLLLAPGVVAIGVGERTTPAGAETLAERALAAGVVHTVLVVPVEQRRATMHLDTVCTMVDVDAVVMYPPIANTLIAYAVTADGVQGPEPFLSAAAKAMGIDRLRVIETGLDPVTAEREQWDDGNNTLALAPRLVVAYERNVETNARLEDAGIEVVRIAGSELGSGRGGPRCMSCPVARDASLPAAP
jgi:arginine deiminase